MAMNLNRSPRGHPAHHMSARALITDVDGRLLAVQPRRAGRMLQLPGGIVEHGEAPGAASERELAEELGLHLGPPRALLTTSWTEPLTGTSRGWVTLLFDHGTHAATETNEQIQLQTNELSDWTWLMAADALEQLHPGQASLLAAARTGVRYFEQKPVSGIRPAVRTPRGTPR